METVENRGKPHVSGFGASSADCGKLWRDFGKVFWGKVIHRKISTLHSCLWMNLQEFHRRKAKNFLFEMNKYTVCMNMLIRECWFSGS